MSHRTWIVKALVIIFLSGAIFGSAGYFSYRLFVAPKKLIKMEQSGPRPTPPPDPSIAEFERCMKLREEGKTEEAHIAMDEFIQHNPESPKIEEVKRILGDLNTTLFFSDTPGPDKQQYVVQKGDTLNAIERKTKVPSDLIMRLNKIEDPTKLRIGQVLNVTKPEFSLKINRKTKVITVLNKGKFFKQYPTGTWSTPTPRNSNPILCKVGEKSAWKDGQRVAFGTKEYAASGRWLSMTIAGYTLYTEAEGTPKPVGGIGMAPKDIDELSTLLNRGIPATIE